MIAIITGKKVNVLPKKTVEIKAEPVAEVAPETLPEETVTEPIADSQAEPEMVESEAEAPSDEQITS